jgi:hypothetical protein
MFRFQAGGGALTVLKSVDQLLGPPASIRLVLCVFPQGVKRPKFRADHSCLVPNLREGGAIFPFFHTPSWCTEGRHYFYCMKFVLQKWGKIFIRIILSNNGVSCHIIMFQILTTCSCYFHYITSRLSSWIWIVILKSVGNMELLVYCSFIYLLVWMKYILLCLLCYMCSDRVSSALLLVSWPGVCG